MRIQNKTIVVTGAGSGVGRELALALLAKDAKVVALDINQKGLEETTRLAADKAVNIYAHVIDITDKAVVEELAAKIISEQGFVDGLINNAGIIQPFIKFNDLDYKTIDRVIDVNFRGTLYMTKIFLPHLLSRPEAHIVNIASMGGFLPVPGQTIYCAAKAAVKLMTEGLQVELTNTKVGVSIVFPRAIRTNIMANSGLVVKEQNTESQKQKITLPADAARQIIAAIEQQTLRVLIGSDSKVMDFLYRLNPIFAAKLIYKKMKRKLSD